MILKDTHEEGQVVGVGKIRKRRQTCKMSQHLLLIRQGFQFEILNAGECKVLGLNPEGLRF